MEYVIRLLPAIHILIYQIFDTKAKDYNMACTDYMNAFTLIKIRNPMALITEYIFSSFGCIFLERIEIGAHEKCTGLFFYKIHRLWSKRFLTKSRTIITSRRSNIVILLEV